MSRIRTTICLPLALLADERLSSNAKVLYALLKSLSKSKSPAGQSLAVIATHREIIDLSNLSLHTVTKSLRALERAGWIDRQVNSGSANHYFLNAPSD